jgi:Zn-dependent metalloprotease
MSEHICSFVPPHVIAHLARVEARDSLEPGPFQRTALVSQRLRDERRRLTADVERTLATLGPTPPAPGTAAREIYDDQNTWAFDVQLARAEGDSAVAQQPVNNAYDALGITRQYYKDKLGRNSIDNLGLNLNANVNFGVSFANAFWDGVRMVFGNGDGVIFKEMTLGNVVVAHELTHGVTQYTAGLGYGNDETGALNESFSDILATAVDASANNKTVETHDWLIGDEVMADQLFGEALRSMAEPGTAYDNPIIGTDPQPRDMSGYVPGGGPHTNSGIPNRWFYLICTGLNSIDDGALIMYQTLQNLWPTAVFKDAVDVATFQARILARDKKVPANAPQVVRGAARAQGMI